jgi:hypothetical protein
MGMNWTDLRFFLNRSAGLFRRGLASLRTRGLHASWQRVQKHLRPVPQSQRPALYFPEAAPFGPFALPVPDAGRVPRASIVIPVYNSSRIPSPACVRWQRTRHAHRSKSSSSTMVRRTPPKSRFHRLPACATTGGW